MLWRNNKSSTGRGYGYRWQKARAEFLRANPLCTYCEQQGIVTAATVVDHIEPHQGDGVLFWARDNWQPLCKLHHDSTKQSQEKTGKQRQIIGADGWPIEG